LSGTPSELGPGTLLGRYEILAPIAAGGMARVWAARMKGSRGFAKTMAVKTLLPGVSDDLRYENMFLDEAHLASQIRHANVVEIHDLGEVEGLLFLVMEYIDGESLNALRRAAGDALVPRRLALKIIADTAAGLHAAHQLASTDGNALGIVHRDVSPQNILISYNGVVKVTDFGIAKAVGRISQTTDTTLKGKPAFMAPEQIAGGDVDCRADVFALGIVAYQLLTGKHPFRGQNDLATVNNIQSDRPILPPRHFTPTLSAGLEEIVLRCLERDPTRRFQSARELEIAIDAELGARRPHDGELAQTMETLLGENGRGRRRELERAIAIADQRLDSDPTLVRHSQAPPVSATSARFSGPPADTGLASVASLRTEEPPKRGVIGVALVLVALALVGAMTVLFVISRRTTQPTSSATEAVRASPAPSRNVEPDPIPHTPVTPAAPEATRTPSHAAVRRSPAASAATPAEVDAAASPPPSASTAKKKAPLPLMEPGF
jgi:serine/threonine protein kinase